MMRILPAVLVCLLTHAAQSADWPQWRGPDRTDVSQETGLLKSWPEGGPAKLWMNSDVGLGYSGMSVVGDTLYTMGSREDKEYLIAVNVRDGSEKWSAEIGGLLSNGWGNGPRGTPTVEGDRIYALGGKGTLVCAAAADGNVLWKVELVDQLGGKIPNWGYTESVLIDGDKVICTPGGKEGALAALQKESGEVLWRSKDFTEGAQYASVIVADHNGQRQYIQLTMKKLAGVDARSGDLLWSVDWPGQTAVIPTPIYRDGMVYVTSGYGVGCMLVKLLPDHQTEVVYQNKTMKNHHGGVVLIGNHLYGHSDGPGWTCQDLLSGEAVWSERKLGKGSLTSADGLLYLFEEQKGEVALIEASTEGYKEHGLFTLEPQTTKRSERGRIWTHPTIANGRLYLRDQELLFCFDIQAK